MTYSYANFCGWHGDNNFNPVKFRSMLSVGGKTVQSEQIARINVET